MCAVLTGVKMKTRQYCKRQVYTWAAAYSLLRPNECTRNEEVHIWLPPGQLNSKGDVTAQYPEYLGILGLLMDSFSLQFQGVLLLIRSLFQYLS